MINCPKIQPKPTSTDSFIKFDTFSNPSAYAFLSVRVTIRHVILMPLNWARAVCASEPKAQVLVLVISQCNYTLDYMI